MVNRQRRSQCDLILAHLKKVGNISFVEAWDSYGVRSLPRRISDLKERGHRITSKEKVHPMTGQRYVRYQLEAAA